MTYKFWKRRQYTVVSYLDYVKECSKVYDKLSEDVLRWPNYIVPKPVLVHARHPRLDEMYKRADRILEAVSDPRAPDFKYHDQTGSSYSLIPINDNCFPVSTTKLYDFPKVANYSDSLSDICLSEESTETRHSVDDYDLGQYFREMTEKNYFESFKSYSVESSQSVEIDFDIEDTRQNPGIALFKQSSSEIDNIDEACETQSIRRRLKALAKDKMSKHSGLRSKLSQLFDYSSTNKSSWADTLYSLSIKVKSSWAYSFSSDEKISRSTNPLSMDNRCLEFAFFPKYCDHNLCRERSGAVLSEDRSRPNSFSDFEDIELLDRQLYDFTIPGLGSEDLHKSTNCLCQSRCNYKDTTKSNRISTCSMANNENSDLNGQEESQGEFDIYSAKNKANSTNYFNGNSVIENQVTKVTTNNSEEPDIYHYSWQACTLRIIKSDGT